MPQTSTGVIGLVHALQPCCHFVAAAVAEIVVAAAVAEIVAVAVAAADAC